MAQELSQLPVVTAPHSADLLYLVDSTGSESSAGTSSQISLLNFLAYINTHLAPSTPLTVAQGGTGLATLTSGSVLVGNGTGNVSLVATTGSGSVVLATSPTLTTPTLGVASATSINKVAFTAPATGSTLTIADGKTATVNNSITLAGTDGKTLTVSNSLTLAGTDSTTITFPSTSASIARTDAAQTFTGSQTFSQVLTTNNAIAASSSAATVPITSKINTVTNDAAATLTVTMTTTSAADGQVSIVRILDHSAVAQTITWVNTENSNTSAPTTSNGSTTLPLTVGFMYNAGTSKWRALASS